MPMPSTVNGRPVRTGAWLPGEDEQLALWQQQLGNRWSAVAKRIPGRTGQQCAQRWRHKVNPNIRKDKWTPEEDEQLEQLVEEHGYAWASISRSMDGRTDQQCMGCWRRHLHPAIVIYPSNPKAANLQLVLISYTARSMDGRTDQQCMGRWRRHLDPAINRAPWAAAEDLILRQQYRRHQNQWSLISRKLPGRTAQQCRARWAQIDDKGKVAPVDTDESGSDTYHARSQGGKTRPQGGKATAAPRGRQGPPTPDIPCAGALTTSALAAARSSSKPRAKPSRNPKPRRAAPPPPLGADAAASDLDEDATESCCDEEDWTAEGYQPDLSHLKASAPLPVPLGARRILAPLQTSASAPSQGRSRPVLVLQPVPGFGSSGFGSGAVVRKPRSAVKRTPRRRLRDPLPSSPSQATESDFEVPRELPSGPWRSPDAPAAPPFPPLFTSSQPQYASHRGPPHSPPAQLQRAPSRDGPGAWGAASQSPMCYRSHAALAASPPTFTTGGLRQARAASEPRRSQTPEGATIPQASAFATPPTRLPHESVLPTLGLVSPPGAGALWRAQQSPGVNLASLLQSPQHGVIPRGDSCSPLTQGQGLVTPDWSKCKWPTATDAVATAPPLGFRSPLGPRAMASERPVPRSTVARRLDVDQAMRNSAARCLHPAQSAPPQPSPVSLPAWGGPLGDCDAAAEGSPAKKAKTSNIRGAERFSHLGSSSQPRPIPLGGTPWPSYARQLPEHDRRLSLPAFQVLARQQQRLAEAGDESGRGAWGAAPSPSTTTSATALRAGAQASALHQSMTERRDSACNALGALGFSRTPAGGGCGGGAAPWGPPAAVPFDLDPRRSSLVSEGRSGVYQPASEGQQHRLAF